MKKLLIPLFIVCLVFWECESAVVHEKRTNVDSIVRATFDDDTPTKRKLDSMFKVIRYRSMYMDAKFKQDSIQIVILNEGTSKKREKLWYHYDSLRVYYAKEQAKFLPK